MNIVSRFFTGMAGGLDGMVRGFKSGILPGLLEEWGRFIYGGYQNTSGEKMTPKNALAIAAFYACVRVIAEVMAKISLNFYKREDDGTITPFNQHPLYHIFNE